MRLEFSDFNRDTCLLAQHLLGKVVRVKYQTLWLSAMVIETEAYYLNEKASHASLGYTEKRKALFMPPGTIYMYYARGADSFNISSKGKGNAVLIKSGYPYLDDLELSQAQNMIETMQSLNPVKTTGALRPKDKLLSGQTLLCKALNLKVPDWDQKEFNHDFYIEDVGYRPQKIIQTTRLGIPKGRDEDLEYRFIDERYLDYCTKKPTKPKPQLV